MLETACYRGIERSSIWRICVHNVRPNSIRSAPPQTQRLFRSISNVQNPTKPTNPTRTKKGPVVCSAAVIPTNLQNPTNPTDPTQKKICRIVKQLASPLVRGHAADRGLQAGVVSAALGGLSFTDGFCMKPRI